MLACVFKHIGGRMLKGTGRKCRWAGYLQLQCAIGTPDFANRIFLPSDDP
jgi:hypothetical protein